MEPHNLEIFLRMIESDDIKTKNLMGTTECKCSCGGVFFASAFYKHINTSNHIKWWTIKNNIQEPIPSPFERMIKHHIGVGNIKLESSKINILLFMPI